VDHNADEGIHELDPPRYIEVDLGNDSSSNQGICQS